MLSKPLINPPRFKPTRDRIVSSLTVKCPTCGVEPRVACVKLDGTPASEGMRHPRRRAMAVRAQNIERGL